MELRDLTTRDDFGRLCHEKGFTTGCEVGVAYGENAERILEQAPNLTLFLIDPWENQPKNIFPDGGAIGNYEEAFIYCKGKLSRFKGRAQFVREYSELASMMFKPGYFDFVYIDGNHTSPQIDWDLENFWLLVKPGGIFGGHDFCMVLRDDYRCDVEIAVLSFAEKHGLKIHLTDTDIQEKSWFIQKD